MPKPAPEILAAACAAWLCLSHAAPAGTSRGRPCEGGPGEVQGANCVPAELLERRGLSACRGEGRDIEGKEGRCCEGLSAIPASRPEDGECRDAPPSVQVCARCGDGVCGPGENRCNCAGDCGGE